jgi:hypothetical protein
VSNHRNVAVLSHHQPAGSRTGTFVPRDVADELVRRLAAERISAKVIRMMPPDSVFLPALELFLLSDGSAVRYIPSQLPPAEIATCKFIPPRTDPRPSFDSVRAGWDWNFEPFPDFEPVPA